MSFFYRDPNEQEEGYDNFKFEDNLDYDELYNMEEDDEAESEMVVEAEPIDYEYYSRILTMPIDFLVSNSFSKSDLDTMVQNRTERPVVNSQEIVETLKQITESEIPSSITKRIEELKTNYKRVCKDYRKSDKKPCMRFYSLEQINSQIEIETELLNIVKDFPKEIKDSMLNDFIIIRFGSKECFVRDILDTQLLYWKKQSRSAQLARKRPELEEAGKLGDFMNLIKNITNKIKKRSRFSKEQVDTNFPYGSPEQLLAANNYKAFELLTDMMESGKFVNEFEFKYNLYYELKQILSNKSRLNLDEIEFIKQINESEYEFPIILNNFVKKEDKRLMYKTMLTELKLISLKKNEDVDKLKKRIKKLKKWFSEYESPIYSGKDYRLMETKVKYYNFKGFVTKGKGRKKQFIWSRETSGLMPENLFINLS